MEWGRLYKEYHKKSYDPAEVSAEVHKLYADPYVKNRKGIFEYSNPTVQDLITWATDSSLAPTTKIARQRTLADILGNILGRVSTVEAVSTKEGKQEFQQKQEIQGNKIKGKYY